MVRPKNYDDMMRPAEINLDRQCVHIELYMQVQQLEGTNNHRKIADTLLAGYQKPGCSKHCPIVFTFLQNYNIAIDSLPRSQITKDLAFMKNLATDKSKPLHHRCDVIYRLGLLAMDLPDHEEAAYQFQQVLKMMDGATEDELEEMTVWQNTNRQWESTVDVLFKSWYIPNICDNLTSFLQPGSSQMYRFWNYASGNEAVGDNIGGRKKKIIIKMNMPTSTMLSAKYVPICKRIYEKAAVNTLHCSMCLKRKKVINEDSWNCEENKRLELKRCSRCKRVAYCSTQCQAKHWKLDDGNGGGHKASCRAPGVFKKGDIVSVWYGSDKITATVKSDGNMDVFSSDGTRNGVLGQLMEKVEVGRYAGCWGLKDVSGQDYVIYVKPENLVLRLTVDEY
ncbi:hypothetical protein HDU76_009937 [Blyttiomyces sp. JEL0837]|nr:hypothetical protein HDU76_009937 [Blyttiomyces sp. JEL0837]